MDTNYRPHIAAWPQSLSIIFTINMILICCADSPVLAGASAFGRASQEINASRFFIRQATGDNCVSVVAGPRNNLVRSNNPAGVPCNFRAPLPLPFLYQGFGNSANKVAPQTTSGFADSVSFRNRTSSGFAEWKYRFGFIDSASYLAQTSIAPAPAGGNGRWRARAYSSDPIIFESQTDDVFEFGLSLSEMGMEIGQPLPKSTTGISGLYKLNDMTILDFSISASGKISDLDDFSVRVNSMLGSQENLHMEQAIRDSLVYDPVTGSASINDLNLFPTIDIPISAGSHTFSGSLIARSEIDVYGDEWDFSDSSFIGEMQTFGSVKLREDGGVNDTGYLSLTDAINNQRGTLVLSDLWEGTDVDAFSFSTDVRMGGGSEMPADGLSINLARPEDPVLLNGDRFAASPLGAPNLPEEGTTTGLAIGFDEWDSGGGDVVGVSIRIDGELVDQIEIPEFNGDGDDPFSLQTGPELSDPSDLEWVPLSIDLSLDNELQISYKGETIFDDVIDYEPGPGRFVIAARTGGANSNHHLDNLRISTLPASREFELTGDFNGSGDLDVQDINALIEAIQTGNDLSFDINQDSVVDRGDLHHWVSVLKNSWIGDANLDEEFNSADFVAVFQYGKFETGEQASWEQGDWNGDQQFSSSDFVAAFQDGGFELGRRPVAATVPEPSSMALIFGGIAMCLAVSPLRKGIRPVMQNRQ